MSENIVHDLGVLTIREGRTDNLVLNEDTGRHDDKPVAVFLFIPNMQNLANHHHIELSVEQVSKMYVWAGRFLNKHTDGQPCKAEDIGIEGPFGVKCPCGCKDGFMQSDGRNLDNDSTFLVCSVCKCCYRADDVAKAV